LCVYNVKHANITQALQCKELQFIT